jgi:hypothetical protein
MQEQGGVIAAAVLARIVELVLSSTTRGSLPLSIGPKQAEQSSRPVKAALETETRRFQP